MEKNSKNLKKLITEQGYKLKEFAEIYHSHSLGEDEIIDSSADKFYNRFRKEISRNKKNNLEKYFNFIFKSDKFKKLNEFQNKFAFESLIDKKLFEVIKDCSKKF